jgi:hypothetical protein
MTVKIKGEEFPIARTMWVLLQFKRDKKKYASELKPEDLEDLLYYTWLCVKGACMQIDKSFDMSFEDYIKYVEGDPTEALMEANVDEIKKKSESK